jgi:tryptophanyl-tRNA synthetase
MITGIKPTGTFPHIGNLLGAMLPLRDNASKYDTALFIPDLHALTTIRDGKILKENTRNALISYLAILGRDTKVTIFRQSDIVGIPKLAWILSCFTPLSLMLRAHTVQDFVNKKSKLAELKWAVMWVEKMMEQKKISTSEHNEKVIENTKWHIQNREDQLNLEEQEINMWTFNYPILMAADILGYDIDVVPVGKDQLQHLEMARDMARYVNHHFKAEIFVEPKPIIDDAVATIIGTDGRKMSKSYNNTISMFENSADLKKKIATIPTDDKTLEDAKDPDTCNVFAMIKMFGTHDEVETIRAKYLAGGYGYWHAKAELHTILDRFITPYRDAYVALSQLSDEELFEPVRRGNAVMQARLDAVMTRLAGYIWV